MTKIGELCGDDTVPFPMGRLAKILTVSSILVLAAGVSVFNNHAIKRHSAELEALQIDLYATLDKAPLNRPGKDGKETRLAILDFAHHTNSQVEKSANMEDYSSIAGGGVTNAQPAIDSDKLREAIAGIVESDSSFFTYRLAKDREIAELYRLNSRLKAIENNRQPGL